LIYSLLRKLGNKDFPGWAAVGVISVSEFFIFMQLLIHDIIDRNSVDHNSVTIVTLLFYYINYLILIKNKDVNDIAQVFNDYSIAIKITHLILTLLFVILPFVLFIKYA